MNITKGFPLNCRKPFTYAYKNLLVHQAQIIKQLKEQAHNDGDQCCQHHALYAEGAEGDLGAGQADNHNNGGYNQVGGFSVINLLLIIYLKLSATPTTNSQPRQTVE